MDKFAYIMVGALVALYFVSLLLGIISDESEAVYGLIALAMLAFFLWQAIRKRKD